MILVTGGTGLVGAHLLLHLAESEAIVRAMYREPMTIARTKSLFRLHQKEELFFKVDWVQADILDVPSLERAFKNITHVYHCAGFISFDPKDENQLRKINIEGTANIVNFCIAKNVQKLCHVSSIAALGNLAQNETTVTEETEWNPEILHSDYAISKFGGEMEVWRGQQEGLNVVIVNPGVILGPTLFESGSGALFSTIKKGIPFYTNGSTGYVSVDDVVKVMVQLMVSDISCERFIVISENKTYKEIIETVAQKLKVKPPKTAAKAGLLSLFWRLDWALAAFFQTKRRLSKHGAISLQNADLISNTKIKNALNFEFQSIDKVIETIV
jgi:nucleoside-diphosphate-sugar epimerase